MKKNPYRTLFIVCLCLVLVDILGLADWADEQMAQRAAATSTSATADSPAANYTTLFQSGTGSAHGETLTQYDTTDVSTAIPLQWAEENWITSGLDTMDLPIEEPCTHAEAITFLWKAVGQPEPTMHTSYPNVSERYYYESAVSWAQENGILSDPTFEPNEACTRQEIVEYLWRYAGCPMSRGTSDTEHVSDAVRWAVEQGIVDDMSDFIFSANSSYSRAKTIALLYRALAKDIEWKFLFVVFRNTDICYTDSSGNEIQETHGMPEAEIDILRGASLQFAEDFYCISNYVVLPQVDFLVVDTPVTFDDLGTYNDTEYWLPAKGAQRLLPDSIDLDDYDHVTAYVDADSKTLGNATYWALGGDSFGQGTGYSFIKNLGPEFVVQHFIDDKLQMWVPELMVHEFLHYMQHWTRARGRDCLISADDGDELGYTYFKKFYIDFINYDVVFEDGYDTGVPCAVWRQPPRMFRAGYSLHCSSDSHSTAVESHPSYSGLYSEEDYRKEYVTVQFPDGTYNGQMMDGMRNGYGEMAYDNGEVYKGDWSGDMYNGYGAFRWTDGRIYSGAFQDGKPNGYGGIYYPDGSGNWGLWQDGEFVEQD